MSNKKFQIFVSSTYKDLIKERQAAVQAILVAGHIPAGMELFSAGDESQWEVIKRWIDECDIFMLILGGRYGSIEPKSGKSYIHLEYEYALEHKKPYFVLIADENALDERVKQLGYKEVMEQDNQSNLKEFKKRLTTTMVSFWKDEKDIMFQVPQSIRDLENQKGKELLGWIKADNSQNTDNQKIDELQNQISKLESQVSDLEKENESLFRDSPLNIIYSGLTFEKMYKILDSEVVIDKEKIVLNDMEYDSITEHSSCDPDEISLALQSAEIEKRNSYLEQSYFYFQQNLDEEKKQNILLRANFQHEKLLDTMRSFGDKNISMIHLLWLLRFKRDKFNLTVYSPLKVNWELLKVYELLTVKNNIAKLGNVFGNELNFTVGHEYREEGIFTKLGQTFLNGLIEIRQSPETSKHKL